MYLKFLVYRVEYDTVHNGLHGTTATEETDGAEFKEPTGSLFVRSCQQLLASVAMPTAVGIDGFGRSAFCAASSSVEVEVRAVNDPFMDTYKHTYDTYGLFLNAQKSVSARTVSFQR